jgi:hypothetical protein
MDNIADIRIVIRSVKESGQTDRSGRGYNNFQQGGLESLIVAMAVGM